MLRIFRDKLPRRLSIGIQRVRGVLEPVSISHLSTLGNRVRRGSGLTHCDVVGESGEDDLVKSLWSIGDETSQKQGSVCYTRYSAYLSSSNVARKCPRRAYNVQHRRPCRMWGHHCLESHPSIWQQWTLTGRSHMGSGRSESRQGDPIGRHLVDRMIGSPILPQLPTRRTSSLSCRYIA